MDSLIITLDDLQRYRPISKNIPQDRVEVFISEAQLHDLRTVLGNALYYDFITKFNDSGDPMYTAYQALLNGSTWTTNGYTEQHYGLKPVVSYYTLARITQNNQILIKQQVNELRSIAISFQEQTINFLQDNISTYPLYGNSKEPLNKTSIKFFHI